MKSFFKNQRLQTQISIMFFSFILFVIFFSFFFFKSMSSILQKNEEVYINNIMEQVMEKIDATAEDSERFAELLAKNQYTQSVLTEDNISANYENSLTLSNLIYSITENNGNIRSILLLKPDDVFIGVDRKNYDIVEELDRKYHVYSPTDYPNTFTNLINTNDKMPCYAYIKTVFNTNVGFHPHEKIGTYVFLNSISSLENHIRQITLPPNSKFVIMDSLNRIIVSSPSEEASNFSQTIQKTMQYVENTSDSFVETVDGEKCLIQYRSISSTGWKILSIIPVAEINADLNSVIRYSAFFVLAVTVLFVFFRFEMSRGIMEPIQNIVFFMEKDGYHSLRHRLAISKHNEIGDLAGHINTMLDKIEDLTTRIFSSQSRMYEMELSKKKAELSALQSQINPHFLYNTLDSIKGYGYLLKSQEIVDITNSLSFIMRYCIKGSEMVPVKDELNCILKYLNIITIRFENRFKIDVDFSDEILELIIPRFLLQPIIENAIYHGLEPRLSGGNLTVKGYSPADSLLTFEIHDTGVGIPSVELEKIKSSLKNAKPQSVIDTNADRSIGLINIDTRIKNIYGESCGLEIQSTEASGTKISITIPMDPSAQL